MTDAHPAPSTATVRPASPPICDYEGSRYRTEFWTPQRRYEDAVERVALRALLPPTGRRLIEIGAGHGRLADLYTGYEQVTLFDYAHSQLLQARERLGTACCTVQGDFYHLPFAAGAFDTVVIVRTLHHAADASAVLRGVAHLLPPGGTLVLEFANKRNLKAVLRYLLRRQPWSPFDPRPVEFAPLNFDFHPRWICQRLAAVGLRVERVRTVSHFRDPLLKRLLPTRLLVALDSAAQRTGEWWQLTPSVFLRATRLPGDEG